MPNREHLLTIVEPTPGGDATLDLARKAVAGGGTASVLMVITERVQRDIQEFADGEDLGWYEAEALALDQLRMRCTDRIGAVSNLETYFGSIGSDVVNFITADTTAIAVPSRLVTNRLVEHLAESSGRPVIVTPSRAAAA